MELDNTIQYFKVTKITAIKKPTEIVTGRHIKIINGYCVTKKPFEKRCLLKRGYELVKDCRTIFLETRKELLEDLKKYD